MAGGRASPRSSRGRPAPRRRRPRSRDGLTPAASDAAGPAAGRTARPRLDGRARPGRARRASSAGSCDSLGLKSRSRARTRQVLAVAAFDPADEEAWERLEEALIAADVGVPATAEIVRRLEARGGLTTLDQPLAEEIAALLGEPGSLDLSARPTVVLVVGVNGTGKTTTIGKLAAKVAAHDRSVVVRGSRHVPGGRRRATRDLGAACGRRLRRSSPRGGDPAAVAYDAIAAATSRGRDTVIVDTAGRLHTQTNLMEELAKVRRVIAGRLEGAPHETLLVVDATTGQNGLQQARLFGQAVEVTGVVLTKLDGSAEGGIAVAIAYEVGLPVTLVGVGEGLDDLRPLIPTDFAQALVSGESVEARGAEVGSRDRFSRRREPTDAGRLWRRSPPLLSPSGRASHGRASPTRTACSTPATRTRAGG